MGHTIHFCILNSEGKVLTWKMTKGLSFEHVHNVLFTLNERIHERGQQVEEFYIDIIVARCEVSFRASLEHISRLIPCQSKDFTKKYQKYIRTILFASNHFKWLSVTQQIRALSEPKQHHHLPLFASSYSTSNHNGKE